MSKIFLNLTLLIYLSCSLSIGQEIRLGIISDYQAFESFDELAEQLRSEVQKTIGQSNKVVLLSDNLVSPGNTLQEASQNYINLSSQSDVIIAFGPVSTKAVMISGDLKVPTIAVGIIDQDIQDLPLTPQETSGMKNFTYVLTTKDLDEDVKNFFEITSFKHLTVLIEKLPGDIFNEAKALEKIHRIEEQYDASIKFLEIGENLRDDLAKISEQSDAVLLSMQLTSVQRIEEISTTLIEKGLPSFSRSKWHVEHGIFCSRSMDNAASQIMRKIAIMVDDAFQEQPLEEMDVYLRNREELYINMGTAKKIGVYPDFKYLFTANLLKDQEEYSVVYSLSEIINYALEANLDIQLSGKDYELSEQDIKFAQSNYFPTLDLQAVGALINKERAILGQAETTISGSSTLEQLIYSEEAIANIKIQKYLNIVQKYALEQDVLAVLLDTYVSYFNLLASKSFLAIQTDNLNVSRRNLELAKVRVSLGSSNNSDVYRWESEVAIAEQAVVDANATLFTVKLQLNVLLGNVLEQDFEIADVKIDDEVYNFFRQGELNGLVSNPGDLMVLSDFLVQEAVNTHPAKRQLLENINAVQRQHIMNKRAFYLPTIAVQGQYSSVFHRAGKGAEMSDLAPIVGLERSDNNWDIGLAISYPLFDATRRKLKSQQTQIQLEQIEIGRLNLDQNLELGVRSRIYQLVGAITNTEFSRVASDNALKSFEMVQDNYRQGMLSIVNLIDAQQAALKAKLGYEISIYDFLIAHLQLEYSIGFFSMQLTPEENQDLRQRFLQFDIENR